jgi:2-dehydro-3-deoxyphosphogluconate aldolase / (4S)-4-hydroxy-2-oxoglutarate aldolase
LNQTRWIDLMIAQIEKSGIVPVVVLDREEDAVPLAEALLAGGLDVMEITFRTAAAEGALKRIAAAFPEILLGAGTLLDVDQVKRARAAGAVFGLAPGLNPSTVAAAAAEGLAFSPGVMTPGEVEQALSLGCKLLKFFPAEAAGGTAMLKSLAGPYAHTGVRFIPTGGIGPKNLQDYLKLPIVAAIGGSWMVEKSLVADGRWSEITALTKAALAAAGAAR